MSQEILRPLAETKSSDETSHNLSKEAHGSPKLEIEVLSPRGHTGNGGHPAQQQFRPAPNHAPQFHPPANHSSNNFRPSPPVNRPENHVQPYRPMPVPNRPDTHVQPFRPTPTVRPDVHQNPYPNRQDIQTHKPNLNPYPHRTETNQPYNPNQNPYPHRTETHQPNIPNQNPYPHRTETHQPNIPNQTPYPHRTETHQPYNPNQNPYANRTDTHRPNVPQDGRQNPNGTYRPNPPTNTGGGQFRPLQPGQPGYTPDGSGGGVSNNNNGGGQWRMPNFNSPRYSDQTTAYNGGNSGIGNGGIGNIGNSGIGNGGIGNIGNSGIGNGGIGNIGNSNMGRGGGSFGNQMLGMMSFMALNRMMGGGMGGYGMGGYGMGGYGMGGYGMDGYGPGYGPGYGSQRFGMNRFNMPFNQLCQPDSYRAFPNPAERYSSAYDDVYNQYDPNQCDAYGRRIDQSGRRIDPGQINPYPPEPNAPYSGNRDVFDPGSSNLNPYPPTESPLQPGFVPTPPRPEFQPAPPQAYRDPRVEHPAYAAPNTRGGYNGVAPAFRQTPNDQAVRQTPGGFAPSLIAPSNDRWDPDPRPIMTEAQQPVPQARQSLPTGNPNTIFVQPMNPGEGPAVAPPQQTGSGFAPSLVPDSTLTPRRDLRK
jgi:hypothetical protein